MPLRAALPPLVCAMLAGLLVASAVTCHTPAPPPPLGPPSPELPPQPVEHPRLRALLPAQAGGYERTAVSASRQPMGAFAMTQAKATYGSPGEKGRIELQVSDPGEGARLLDIGAVWIGRELEEEHPHGYERTTWFLGHPAYERFDARGEPARAEMQLIVADRFFVEARGSGVPMESMRDAVASLDLSSLAALAAASEGGREHL